MAGPRLCIDCMYHRESFVAETEYHSCWKTVDVVTGKTKPTPCSTVRNNPKLCGSIGKWYKPDIDADAPGLFDEPAVEFEPAE